MEEEIRSLKNEIYQVIGFFSAFQGLLITAAAQSNLLRCNNVGFILALSAFATAIAVFGIWQKITAMEQSRLHITRIREQMKGVDLCLIELKTQGIEFNFDWFRKFENKRIRHFDRSSTAFWRWKKILVSYGTWLVVSVIAFGGLCMLAMRQIVCNPGHSLPSN